MSSESGNRRIRSDRNRIGAVLVATGLAVTPGKPKRLIAARGKTYTESLVEVYLDAGVDTIVVVTGEHDAILRKALANTTAVCIKDDHYQNSSFLDSARLGIQLLEGVCDRIFVSPIETGLTDEKTLLKLMSKRADVVCPVIDGADASPLLLSSKMAKWCLLYNGNRGIKGACRSLIKSAEAVSHRVKVSGSSGHVPGTERGGSADSVPVYRPVINWI